MSEDIINRRAIQWFPGHMAKTLRLMETEIRNVDCVLQILDARIPLSSLNPEIERITSGKPHLYIMNKADLADPDITAQWLAYFKSAGAGCLPMNSKQSGKAGAVKGPIEKELSALMERRRKKRHDRCPHPCDGGGHSQCGQIHLHQFLCRCCPRQSGQQTRRYPRQTVDHRG